MSYILFFYEIINSFDSRNKKFTLDSKELLIIRIQGFINFHIGTIWNQDFFINLERITLKEINLEGFSLVQED